EPQVEAGRTHGTDVSTVAGRCQEGTYIPCTDLRLRGLQPCHHEDMPRIKSDQERGPIGAWMRRERIARDWSQKEMPERLATVGQRVDADYYRQLEAGKRPGPEVMDAL